MPTLMLKRTDVKAVIPTASYPGDAGIDITCIEGGIIWPFCTKDLDTGWEIKVPDGYWGSLKARSSTLFKRKLMINEGVFDSGYTGRLSVLVFNPTPFPKYVKPGTRLAQLIIVNLVNKKHLIIINTWEKMPLLGRGNRGFGSTDSPLDKYI